ncbi:MAG: esterase/lipase family protein [Myxococcota bacterium]
MFRGFTFSLFLALAGALLIAGCGDAEGLVDAQDPAVEEEEQSPPEPEQRLLNPALRGALPVGSLEEAGPRLPASQSEDEEPAESCDPEQSPDCEPTAPLGPPYPVVLAHGFFGFDSFAGIDFITYFYRVLDYLAEAGEHDIFITTVDPFNDSVARGSQLLAQVEDIVTATSYEKINLIGHSQGGLDSRYVAHHRPDLVASVTTFATPHRGTAVADIALRMMSHDRTQEVVDAIVQLAGAPLWDTVDEETSLAASLRQLSTEGAAEFNAVHTDSPEVTYFSLTGRSGMHTGWPQCSVGERPDFIRKYDGYLDPVDPMLLVTQQILAAPFNLRPNDGLVRVEDAYWGRFLGCVPADHLDEIGHLFGTIPGLLNFWRHGLFYVELVEFLRDEGF